MAEITIAISSPPDREKLVAEIFVDSAEIAEINQEGDELLVEIYPRQDGKPWVISYYKLLSVMEEAKEKLLR